MLLDERVEPTLRDSHFDVAVGRRQIDGSCDLLNRGSDSWPASGGQHHDGDTTLRQVLLIPQIRIGRHETLESRSLGGLEQLTVREGRPASLVRRLDRVRWQRLAERCWCALIEQD